MLNRARDDRVRNTGNSSRRIVLRVREAGITVLGRVVGFKAAAGFMETAKLNGNAGTNADERREGAFVESKGTFFSVDGLCRFEGVGVLVCCLEPHLNNIKWLACYLLDCDVSACMTDGIRYVSL